MLLIQLICSYGLSWGNNYIFLLSQSLCCRLQNYDATCRLAQEIAENTHERNRQQRTGGNPAKVRCCHDNI